MYLILCQTCKNQKATPDGRQKFCSRSCAAKTNNKRIHTIISKRKVSLSLGGKGVALEDHKCLNCNKTISPKAKSCVACRPNESYPWNSFWKYEKDVLVLLENKYGKLTKEKINGIAFDFCNSGVVIEFTFDSTRGINNLINRFKCIKKEKRRKIAYVPKKDFGNKRRGLLDKLGVEIEYSDKYLYLFKS